VPFKLDVNTPPAAEPLHLRDAKLYINRAVDYTAADAFTYDDSKLTAMIASARGVAEGETWKTLVLQVFDYYLDSWPSGREIQIPRPPLRSVVFVKYTESDGTVNTFSTSYYDVDTDSTFGRIVLGYGDSWPTETLTPTNPIHIQFIAGYATPFTANKDTEVLTALNHTYSDGDKLRLTVSGGSLPTGLSTKTDYYARDVVSGTSLKLAASSGGAAIDISDVGSGTMFLGEIPETTLAGIRLLVADNYTNRSDTVVGYGASASMVQLPRGASALFALDSVRDFV